MYLPILKTRQAEIDAIKELSQRELQAINPLFLIVPKKKTIEKDGEKVKIYKTNQELLTGLQEYIKDNLSVTKVFIDGSIIYPGSKSTFLKDILETSMPDNVVPVLALHDFQNGLKFTEPVSKKVNEIGFCLRINFDQFKNRISSILSNMNFSPNLIDLVIDLSILDETKIQDFLDNLDSDIFRRNWRSITVASGSFPKDLTGLNSGQDHFFKRYEWDLWTKIRKDTFFDFRSEIIFSDYSVQYPIYEEIEGPVYPSFSLKYTLKDNYLVKKGRASNSRFYRNNKNGSPFKQYQVHANLLVSSDKYSGEDFSSGDKYIKEKSDLTIGRPGSHKQWIQASLNHHFSLTIKQIEDEMSAS